MTKSPSEIVSEEEVQLALDYLRDNAAKIGQLTTDAHFTESWVKVAKAVAMKHAAAEHPSAAAQEREALATEEVKAGYKDASIAAGKLATEKALREAAALKIEVWRTQSSNWRSMKL